MPTRTDLRSTAVASARRSTSSTLVRNAIAIEQIAPGPSDRFLLPGPAVPLTATAGDGSVSFDGKRIYLEWTTWAEEAKKSAGPQEIAHSDVTGVEWVPIVGWTNGFLRFRVSGASALEPKHDPYCVQWGWQQEGGTTSLLAAAVVARLPHPSDGGSGHRTPEALPAGSEAAAGEASTDDHHDAVLRRLRELGDLHRDGVLTDEEFADAKHALLRRL
jgi:hypothetical protein